MNCQKHGNKQSEIQFFCIEQQCKIENKLMCCLCTTNTHFNEIEGVIESHKYIRIKNMVQQLPEKLKIYQKNNKQLIQQFGDNQVKLCEDQLNKQFQGQEEFIDKMIKRLQDYDIQIKEFKQYVVSQQKEIIKDKTQIHCKQVFDFPQNKDDKFIQDNQKFMSKLFKQQLILSEAEILEIYQPILQHIRKKQQSKDQNFKDMQNELLKNINEIINEGIGKDNLIQISQKNLQTLPNSKEKRIIDQQHEIQSSQDQQGYNLEQQLSKRKHFKNEHYKKDQQKPINQKSRKQQKIRRKNNQKQNGKLKGVDYYLNMSDPQIKQEFDRISVEYLQNDINIKNDSWPRHNFIYMNKIRTQQCYICHQRTIVLQLMEELGPVYQIGLGTGKMIYVHYGCIMYTNRIRMDKANKFTNVKVLIKKYKYHDCKICGKNMASMKFQARGCKNYYHYACALKDFKDYSCYDNQQNSMNSLEEESQREVQQFVKHKDLSKEICHLDNLQYAIFCSNHRDQGQSYIGNPDNINIKKENDSDEGEGEDEDEDDTHNQSYLNSIDSDSQNTQNSKQKKQRKLKGYVQADARDKFNKHQSNSTIVQYHDTEDEEEEQKNEYEDGPKKKRKQFN